MQMPFKQWLAYESQRAGYLTMNKTMLNLMQGINDPRIPFYAKANKTGGFDETSSYGAYTNKEKLPMISYMEAKFIEAEAQLRAGAKDKAATALQ